MKRALVRIIMAAVLLLASASIPVLADGPMGPFCCPGCNCL